MEVPANPMWGTIMHNRVRKINETLSTGCQSTEDGTTEKTFIRWDIPATFIPDDRFLVHIDQLSVDAMMCYVQKQVILNV